MNTADAACRWASTWERGWAEHDVEAIVGLYADGAVFRTSPFREPGFGPAGVREYVEWAFGDEERAETRFAAPVVAGRFATGEWWTVLTAGGKDTTLAGVSLLEFDGNGLVVAQADYWHDEPGRREPHADFGRWPH